MYVCDVCLNVCFYVVLVVLCIGGCLFVFVLFDMLCLLGWFVRVGLGDVVGCCCVTWWRCVC